MDVLQQKSPGHWIRPLWQRDALKRLVQNDELTRLRLRRPYGNLQGAHGLVASGTQCPFEATPACPPLGEQGKVSIQSVIISAA